MSQVIKLKKGLDILLQGEAKRELTRLPLVHAYALKPEDFPGVTPKLLVRVDDEVKVGTPLFFDKYRPQILFTSPVSGKVSAIVRGEKRKILEVVIDVAKRLHISTVAEGIETAEHVQLMREMHFHPDTVGLIVNRAPNGELDLGTRAEIERQGLYLLGVVPQDDTVYRFDCDGRPMVELPADSPVRGALGEIAAKLGL